MSEKIAIEFGRMMSQCFSLDKEGYIGEYTKYKAWREKKDKDECSCYDCGVNLPRDTAIETNDWGIIVTYCKKHSEERFDRITAKPNKRVKQMEKHNKGVKTFFKRLLSKDRS
jgi:hypothetical protein